MTITFLRTYDEALEARFSFADCLLSTKRFRRYGLTVASLVFFLILLFLNHPLEDRILIDGRSTSVVAGICLQIPFSVLFGWLAYKLLESGRRNAIVRGLKRLPSESFGMMSVTIDTNGLTVQTPLSKSSYDWRLVTSVSVTSKYVFLCADWTPLASIPVSALDPPSQLSELVAKAERLIASYKTGQAAEV